jgi:hypothetical protein
MKLQFSWQIFEKKVIKSKLITIRPVGAKLSLLIDRRTDLMEVIGAFCNFFKSTKT